MIIIHEVHDSQTAFRHRLISPTAGAAVYAVYDADAAARAAARAVKIINFAALAEQAMEHQP